MMHSQVSVIVPVYNVEHYIHRALDSLLNQTYPHLDIILVDDGSPDKCPQICDEYARKDNRVRVIHKKNGGLSDARNVGLDIATGEYITFLDSDDYILPDTVEKFLRTAHEQNVDVVCCGLNIIDTSGRIYDYRKCEASFKASGEAVVKLLLKDVFPYNFSPAKFYKRTLFDGIHFPVGRIYEDMATTYIAISKANSVYCMKECMYNYERKREGNISSELNTIKAAWSYYCGCLNCEERISFCRQIPQYSDMLPIIVSNLYIWSKLCIETAINLDRDEYNAYCQKVKNILRDISVSMPLRIRLIARFSGIYYYLYPIIRRNK